MITTPFWVWDRNNAFPINPMELSSPVRVIDKNDQYTVCINAFRPPLDSFHDLDYLLGDVFMRNVYSVYAFSPVLPIIHPIPPTPDHATPLSRFNFGNGSTTQKDNSADAKGASIQFLSRTNRDQVYANFVNQRKNSLRMYPPLFDLTKLHTDGSTDGGGRLEPPSDG